MPGRGSVQLHVLASAMGPLPTRTADGNAIRQEGNGLHEPEGLRRVECFVDGDVRHACGMDG